MDAGSWISLIVKFCGFIKSIFWKNKNIVYINGNVKNLNIEEIKGLIKPSDSKYINCQSNKNNSISSYKKHFLKQRIDLYQILRNCRDSSKITYCGFSSQMFSVFDGYVLGDTFNYNFIELRTNNKYYKVTEKKHFIRQNVEIDDTTGEINLIIETSYEIDTNKILNNPCVKFSEQEPSILNNEYLNKIYSFVKSALDECCHKNIKIVNIYLTAKQSVAFVIGSAIQSCHPYVRVFHYDNNEYKYYLEIQSGKIKEIV